MQDRFFNGKCDNNITCISKWNSSMEPIIKGDRKKEKKRETWDALRQVVVDVRTKSKFPFFLTLTHGIALLGSFSPTKVKWRYVGTMLTPKVAGVEGGREPACSEFPSAFVVSIVPTQRQFTLNVPEILKTLFLDVSEENKISKINGKIFLNFGTRLGIRS